MYKIILFIWLLFEFLISQTIIGPGLTRINLFDYLKTYYKTSTTLGYNQARDVMYSIIDLEDDNTLKGIYTNYTITIDPNQDPRPQTNAQNMNCEHSWPQSMGAGSEPQKSDLHHLYPCRGNVNSSRGNKPYAEIDDNDTDKWWRFDYYETSIPSQYIDEFSEVDNDNGKFEPREVVKGNIARGMFYFFTIYNDDADHNFFEEQKDFLNVWHKQDPVDDIELARTLSIASYQDDIVNPFVIDSTLVKRIWYFNCYENVTSQILIENIIGDNNYEATIDINSDNKINIIDLIYMIHRESGETAYFICN
jgi:endonuclease I